MSTAEAPSSAAARDATTANVDLKLEVVVIPVSGVDRAKAFYGGLGWRLDADFSFDNGVKVVQFTPPGSPTSIQFGTKMADHENYRSFVTFSDPDGNRWLLQEVTSRLPGRVDPSQTAFASQSDLAGALRRAEAGHGEHERRTGQPDPNWPEWYARYIAAEQAGQELPT